MVRFLDVRRSTRKGYELPIIGKKPRDGATGEADARVPAHRETVAHERAVDNLTPCKVIHRIAE
jgi:hypothetical protein